jgi:8-oxo-dGTP pyrophosphatase MutT (NUDIX family)
MCTDYKGGYIALVTTAPAPDPPIRPAATILVLRRSADGFEVLMVRRASSAVFMGDAYVYPGGSLDDADRGPLATQAVCWDGASDELPWRAAALRELVEEAGVFVTDPPGVPAPGEGSNLYRGIMRAGARFDGRRLAYLSNWVTPRGAPRRFDTRFFVTEVPKGTAAEADRREVFDQVWVTPAEALRRAADGEWQVEFPTRVHLELLEGFESPAAVIAHANAQDRVARIEPRIAFDDEGGFSVLLPGQPGYEAAPS